MDGADLEVLSLGVNWWLTRRAQASVDCRDISLDRLGLQGDSSGLNARLLLMLDCLGRTRAAQFEGVSLEPFFALLAINALIVQLGKLLEAVVSDAADDKFFACALAASGYEGVEVLRPRSFVGRYL